jgi:2-polyprenyl-3-methyl-5-hydroxy-6-metoxy-1,4-benzoquinol methylase
MSDKYSYTIIDGIKCYSPSISSSYSDYPHEGFDVTNENVNSSFWVKSRNRLFKYLIEKNTPSKETSFLEIGCGTGNFISTILENKNLTITGSEIYLNGLKYAQNNTPNVEFIQLDISEKALEQRFDIIAAFDVIEHIEDDCMAIININKMLAEEGIIIISVPQHMFMWSALDEIVKHKRRYSRS